MSWSEACFLGFNLLCLVLFLQRTWQLRRSVISTRQLSPSAHPSLNSILDGNLLRLVFFLQRTWQLRRSVIPTRHSHPSPSSNLDRDLSDFEVIIRLPSDCDPAKLSDLRAKLLYDGGVTSCLASNDQDFSMTFKIGPDTEVEIEWIWRIWRWATSPRSPRVPAPTVTNLRRLRVFVGDSIVDIINDATCICETRSAVSQENKNSLGGMIVELHSMDEDHRYRIIPLRSP